MKTHALLVLVALAVVLGVAPSPVRAEEPVYSEAELDQMLAPVALYPDSVLTNVLIASTYPLQVVAAARWRAANSDLDSEAALAAVDGMDWDPAVKALVAFPDLLARMNDDLDWTQRVGDAFLAQQGDVLDRVQALRSRAYDAGNLKTSEHVRVVRVPAETSSAHRHTSAQTIVIEPVRERVVYVPVYDTRVVYGPWWWHSHPPVHWTWPGRHYSSVGLFWGRGIAVHPVYFHGYFHWHNRYVYYGGNRWHHRPRYHYNRPHETRRPVERHKPPVRAGHGLVRDVRDPVARPRLSTSSRPVRTAPRAIDSRPVVAPTRSAPSMSRQAPAATRQAPSMTRQAPTMRAPAVRSAPAHAAPSRAATPSRSVTPQVRGAPMSKPAPSAAVRAPAAASAPRAAPSRSSSRAQPQRKQN